MKDSITKKALRLAPLPSKFKHLDSGDFKIKFSMSVKLQIAAMNLIIAAVAGILAILIVAVMYEYCNLPILYPVRVVVGTQSFCDSFVQSKFGVAVSSVVSSSNGFQSSNNAPGSLSSTAQWTAAINANAQKYNIDACILRVVVQKESGGDASAIGCDCAAKGKPQLCTDSSRDYYSGYKFNWAQCSYGIGLTQWTIFPQGSTGFAAWENASRPSRSVESSWHGVSDFLDSSTSLDLTAHVFSDNLAKANGNVATAFGNYVGASSKQAQLVSDRMTLYNLCKSNSN
jgi:hypothetical protein